MSNKFWMTNVVWYDGQDAFVSKFILKCEEGERCIKATEESEGLVGQYLNGNGEVLKIDVLYRVDLDNIIALKNADDEELQAAYDRFEKIYF